MTWVHTSMDTYIPHYIQAKQRGDLVKKIEQASALLVACTLCPRQCRKDRTREEKGYCATGKKAVVSSWAPHFGEEPPLVGTKGSGTLFFSHCNLKCVFCQNYDISVEGYGQEADEAQIASIMVHLQRLGCHNINLVTPSHVVPQILKALDMAIDLGLNIPLVYNCSGYESLDTLKILNGVMDIYMPDFKFWESETAKAFCHAQDYPDTAKKAITEMQAQVGELKTDKNGIACSGLLVRHLVMPGCLDETREILDFLKEKISPQTHVNLMSQYRPMGKAPGIKAISRAVTVEEFRTAKALAKAANLKIIR